MNLAGMIMSAFLCRVGVKWVFLSSSCRVLSIREVSTHYKRFLFWGIFSRLEDTLDFAGKNPHVKTSQGPFLYPDLITKKSVITFFVVNGNF